MTPYLIAGASEIESVDDGQVEAGVENVGPELQGLQAARQRTDGDHQ